jgi:hypothetical protein
LACLPQTALKSKEHKEERKERNGQKKEREKRNGQKEGRTERKSGNARFEDSFFIGKETRLFLFFPFDPFPFDSFFFA